MADAKESYLLSNIVFFWFVQFTKEADILDLFNYECDSAAYFGQYNTCKCPYWGEI